MHGDLWREVITNQEELTEMCQIVVQQLQLDSTC